MKWASGVSSSMLSPETHSQNFSPSSAKKNFSSCAGKMDIQECLISWIPIILKTIRKIPDRLFIVKKRLGNNRYESYLREDFGEAVRLYLIDKDYLKILFQIDLVLLKGH